MPEMEASDELLLAEELQVHADWICGWVKDFHEGRCSADPFKKAMRGVGTDLRGLAHSRILGFSVASEQLRLGGLWRPADHPPAALPAGDHLPVEVWWVVDDPNLRLAREEPFQDVVAWWPARQVWTVTHQTRADKEAEDYPVRVVAWRPLPPLPPRGTVWR